MVVLWLHSFTFIHPVGPLLPPEQLCTKICLHNYTSDLQRKTCQTISSLTVTTSSSSHPSHDGSEVTRNGLKKSPLLKIASHFCREFWELMLQGFLRSHRTHDRYPLTTSQRIRRSAANLSSVTKEGLWCHFYITPSSAEGTSSRMPTIKAM